MVVELASHLFLEGLSPEQLAALLEIATRVQFKAGEAHLSATGTLLIGFT